MEKMERRDMKKIYVMALSCLILLTSISLSGAVAATVKETVPLLRLTPLSTVDLKGPKSSYVVKVPIPERWRVKRAVLHLSFVNSSSLLPHKSYLAVSFNDRILTQIKLHPQSPAVDAEVEIPPQMLRPIYNDLEFSATQSITERCEDPWAPGLWTSLQLGDSYFEFEYDRKEVPLNLASLADFLFDPKLMGLNLVNIVLADLSPENVYSGVLVAAAVAIRFDYRPVHFSVSSKLRPGVDNVAVGSAEFVSRLVRNPVPRESGAFLGIFHLPGGADSGQEDRGAPKSSVDSTHAVITIVGSSDQEIRKAVRAFSSLSFPWPDAQSSPVGDVALPEISRYSGKSLLRPGHRYSFQSLGFATETFRGYAAAPKDLNFRIPADALIKPNAFAVLSLSLEYGSAMRRDSVLNIMLNGRFAAAVPLNSETGGRFEGYRIGLPMYLFRRGWNTITFSPVLTPLQTGECVYIQTENLRLSVFGASLIEVPDMKHWIRMPDVAAFFQDGFPFAKWPDWRETTAILAEKTEESAATLINVIAMISQRNGLPPFKIEIADRMVEQGGRDLFAVGLLSSLADGVLKSSPVASSLPYPFVGNTPGSPKPASWWQKITGKISSDEQSSQQESGPSTAKLDLHRDVGGGRLFLTEFQSPYDNERTVMAVCARRAEDLLRGAAALWNSGVQAKCKDDIVIIRLEEPEFKTYTQKAASAYYVGKIGPVNRLNRFMHIYPLIFLGFLVLGLIVVVYLVRRRLQRFRAGRVEHE